MREPGSLSDRPEPSVGRAREPASALATTRHLALYSLVGFIALVLAAWLSVPDYSAPPGWTVIRPPVEVSALAVRGDEVWAGGRDGLVLVDRFNSELKPLPGNPPAFQYVRDLLFDSSAALWVAHQQGLSRYADGEWEHLSEADGLPPGPATALWQDRQGTLWVGSEQGVVRLEVPYSRAYPIRDGLVSSSVDVIFQDRGGVIWFGSASPTRGGLASFDGVSWYTYSTRDGLAHNSVNAILQDRSGALWFGTGFHDRGGASRLSGGVWTTWSKNDGLAGEKVRSIFEDRDGRLWFGSEYDGIAVYDGRSYRVLTPIDGLAGWEVKEIVQDADGVYWLGTTDGLSRIGKLGW